MKKYIDPHSAWRNRGDNLIAYVKTKEKAEKILGKRGQVIWSGGYLRFRPALDEGEIDRYYKIRACLDYKLPADLAIAELEKRWALWQVVIGDSKMGDDGTLIVYAWLNSESQMNELGAAIVILGCSCHICHSKLYKCKHCCESGHWGRDALLSRWLNKVTKNQQYHRKTDHK